MGRTFGRLPGKEIPKRPLDPAERPHAAARGGRNLYNLNEPSNGLLLQIFQRIT